MITPALAAQELLSRRRARESLLAYAQRLYPTYEFAEHHQQIANLLERLERREIRRAVIEVPPRHGKSTLANVIFSNWYMGRHPDEKIITTSYGADLATDFGRDARNNMAQIETTSTFRARLANDSKAADAWRTTSGGSYFAVGAGGALTGRGGHVLLVDDILKDQEEADSQRIKDKIWAWYTSTLYTRLMPGGLILVIMTRWAEDDLVGRILKQAETTGQKWERLRLPAIANEHTDQERALWPTKYPIETLREIRATLPPRQWSALYQQEPAPETGTYFQRDWFRRYTTKPAHYHAYITSDFGVTERAEGNDPDYTELAVWAVNHDRQIYALDWWYGQTTSNKWIDALIDLAVTHKIACFFGESGVIRRAIEPYLTARMHQRKAFFRVEWITSMTDKTVRARAFQGLASCGNVFFPANQPWAERIISQLAKFPGASHDDAVDACSMIGMTLDQAHPGIVKKPADLRTQNGATSWRTA